MVGQCCLTEKAVKDAIVALLMMKIRHQNADYSASPLSRDVSEMLSTEDSVSS